MTAILISQIILSIVLASIFLIRPSTATGTGSKILAFIGLAVLPGLCIVGGMNFHMQRSEQTRFCISCHAMAPYGRSLYVDDSSHIPAQHFQNHRVPPEMACYSCHADYTIYGPLKDKLEGVKRIYMQYIGTPPNPIHIRGAYNNQQCLHCHDGARNFEENPVHASMLDSLKSNQISCLTAGCHDMIHRVAGLSQDKFWRPVP